MQANAQIPVGGSIQSEFKRAHVIVIDDDATNRALLRGVCTKLGIGIIDEAEDGASGLELVRRLKPDLILLDVRMPHMDGMELMRRLRTDPGFENLAILIQTGLQGADDRLECFNLGATDVISQPFHLPELKARIRAHLRSAIAARTLFDFRNRIQAHVEITHNFLSAILPSPDYVARIGEKYGIDCTSAYQPHDEIGGDFWTLREIDEDTLAIILVDASAHGLAGAINALRVDCLLQTNIELFHDPAALLNHLDREMEKISFGQLFAGAVALTFNKRSGEIKYAGSGNPSPLHERQKEIRALKTGGLPLGSGLLNLTNQTAQFESGDTLLIFSDGWSDSLTTPPADMLRSANRTGNLAKALCNDAPLSDDLTLITIQRR